MSPILVRPVREQLEHDRIIRLLQTKNRRKYDAGINPGSEQNVPVGTGPSVIYPDLVLNVARSRPTSAGDRRSRNGRIGQSSRSARRMGPICQNSRALSLVRPLEHGRCRATPVRRKSDYGQRNLELSRHGRRCAFYVGPSHTRGRACSASDRASPGDRCKGESRVHVVLRDPRRPPRVADP